MAKDPAINWYFDNWDGGTKLFTRHLKGCYMDLLSAQFHNGMLSIEDIEVVLGADFKDCWPKLRPKFSEVDNLFFNERLEQERKKRKAYSESRAKNRSKKDMNNISSTYEKDMKNICETYEKHMNNIPGIGIGTEIEIKNDTEIEKKEILNSSNSLNYSEPSVLPQNGSAVVEKKFEPPQKKVSDADPEKKEKKVAPKKEKKVRADGEPTQPFMAMFVAMWQEFNWSKQNQANPAEAMAIEDFRKVFRPTPTDMSNLRKIIVAVRALCEAKKIVWTQEYARKSWKKFLDKAWEQDRWLREHFLLKNLNQNKDLILQNNGNDAAKSINGNYYPQGEKLGTSDARERAIKNFGLAKYLDGGQPPNR